MKLRQMMFTNKNLYIYPSFYIYIYIYISNEKTTVPVQRKYCQLFYGHYVIYPKKCRHLFVFCHKVSSVLLSIKISLGYDEVNQNINLQNRFVNFNKSNIFRKFVANLSFQCTIFTWI